MTSQPQFAATMVSLGRYSLKTRMAPTVVLRQLQVSGMLELVQPGMKQRSIMIRTNMISQQQLPTVQMVP